MPAEVVLIARLRVGLELDREWARRLNQERRRHDAMARAARALGRRDLSQRELAERLSRSQVPPAARDETVQRLLTAGAIDDERLAQTRAEMLTERGAGDALIRHDLESRGIAAELVEQSVCALEPESIRAIRIAQERGASLKTARHLARKGFSPESIESACEKAIAEDAPPAVR